MGVRSLSCRSLLWFADSFFLTVTGLALFFCPSLLGHQDRSRDQTVQMMGASVAALGGLLLSHANGMPLRCFTGITEPQEAIGEETAVQTCLAVQLCYMTYHAQIASVQLHHNATSAMLHINFAVSWLWSFITDVHRLPRGVAKCLAILIAVAAGTFTTRTMYRLSIHL